MHKVKNKPIDPDDITNKEYVDGKQRTIKYADYLALSEEDKKGVTFFVPDLPVSTSGEIIGDVEYGDFFSSDIEGTSLSEGCIIDFHQKTTGNLTYDNGVKLNKGKFYLVYCNIAYLRNEEGNSHLRFEVRINGNQIWATNGIAIASGSTSAWSDGALMIHYKCTGDNDLLTINCVSVAGVDTILGGLSKLIITEIPNYQGLIDVSDEHIKEVMYEATLLESGDLNTIPVHSKTVYHRISNASASSGNISNLPTNYGGLVISVGISNIHQFYLSSTYNEVYKRYGYYDSDNNIIWANDWEKLSSTKVGDVSITSVTTSGLSSGYISYSIKNGICTVSLNSIKVNEGGKLQNITSGSKIPSQINKNSWHQIFTTEGQCVFVRPDNNGELQVYSNCDANYMYHGTIMYVVS